MFVRVGAVERVGRTGIERVAAKVFECCCGVVGRATADNGESGIRRGINE